MLIGASDLHSPFSAYLVYGDFFFGVFNFLCLDLFDIPWCSEIFVCFGFTLEFSFFGLLFSFIFKCSKDGCFLSYLVAILFLLPTI